MDAVSAMNKYKNDFNCIKSIFCASSLHKLLTCICDFCLINTEFSASLIYWNLTRSMILISDYCTLFLWKCMYRQIVHFLHKIGSVTVQGGKK